MKGQNSWFLGLVLSESIINSIVPKPYMAFIRNKKIAGKEYAYLVQNKWYKRRHKGKNKGPRQKVSKYLGRVHVLGKVNDVDFYNFKKINVMKIKDFQDTENLRFSRDLEQYLKKNNNSKNSIFKDLIEWELFRHNISDKEFTIDYSNKKVLKNNKPVSLKMNEGFLNSFTLSRIYNLKSNDSYYLAKCFVEAGIEIPKEVFVGMFGG